MRILNFRERSIFAKKGTWHTSNQYFFFRNKFLTTCSYSIFFFFSLLGEIKVFVSPNGTLLSHSFQVYFRKNNTRRHYFLFTGSWQSETKTSEKLAKVVPGSTHYSKILTRNTKMKAEYIGLSLTLNNFKFALKSAMLQIFLKDWQWQRMAERVIYRKENNLFCTSFWKKVFVRVRLF